MLLSRSTDLQVWELENLSEKSDRIMRIDVPREAVVRNANGQVFLDFILALFPKCKVLNLQERNASEIEVHLCARQLFVMSFSVLPFFFSCGRAVCDAT